MSKIENFLFFCVGTLFVDKNGSPCQLGRNNSPSDEKNKKF